MNRGGKMEEIDTIILKDQNRYTIIDKIEEYYYLVNIKDVNDFCIRKVTNNDNSRLRYLNDIIEFDKALKLFREKYQK